METDKSVEWLLEHSPSLVLHWLREAVEGVRPLPVGFNWHGLAECAASDVWRSNNKPSSYPDVGWANVAVFAYSYIIDKVKEQGHFLQARPGLDAEGKKHLAFSFEESLMNVRARCIIQLGSVSGDPVLDITDLVQWFFQDLRFSPEEAREKSALPREQLSHAESWELTRIRRKLTILQRLQQQQVLSPDQELQHWFAVWG